MDTKIENLQRAYNELNSAAADAFRLAPGKRSRGVLKVYIAGPFTVGDQIFNIRRAVDCAERVFKAGYIPFVPHLDAFWHLLHPRSAEDWYRWSAEWLKTCDAVIRLPGYSAGSDNEEILAKQLGIPVYKEEEFYAVHGRRQM